LGEYPWGKVCCCAAVDRLDVIEDGTRRRVDQADDIGVVEGNTACICCAGGNSMAALSVRYAVKKAWREFLIMPGRCLAKLADVRGSICKRRAEETYSALSNVFDPGIMW
jgi:hypothetical protein